MTIDYTLHQFRSPLFQSVVEEAVAFFAATPAHMLPPAESFNGVGVYALYLAAEHPLYGAIADQTLRRPLYVGKAVPSGWRTARSSEATNTALYRRLREHARSITQANNLSVADFRCRFMLLDGVETDLIVPVEAALIRRHRPLWNTWIDGFGNHDPGSGRYNQAKSEWDVLHPGRPWAEKLTGESPALQAVLDKLQAYKNRLP